MANQSDTTDLQRMASKKKVVLSELSDMETLLEKFKVKNGGAAATGNFQKQLQKPHLSEDSGVIAIADSSKIVALGKSSTRNVSLPEFVIRTTSTSGAETQNDKDKTVASSILDGSNDYFADRDSKMQTRYASATDGGVNSIAQNKPSGSDNEFVQNRMMAQSAAAAYEATTERRKLVNCLDSMTELFMEFKQSNSHTTCQLEINGLKQNLENLNSDYKGTYYFYLSIHLIILRSNW